MKKRIFMLALVVGVLLSFSASAWAADETHIFFKLTGLSVLKSAAEDNLTKISFEVSAEYEVASADDTSAKNPATDFSDGWYRNANLVKWTVGGSTNTFTPTTVYTVTPDGTGSTTVTVTSADQYHLIYPFTSGIGNPPSNGPYKFTVVVTGVLEDPDADCQVRVSLYNAKDSSSLLSTYTSGTTEVEEVDGADWIENEDVIDTDPRNPDGTRWDGKDPIFYNTAISGDYDKAKPKLGKVDKSKLDFTKDTEGTLEVPLVGPITELDVYIAGKDAMKLWPDAGLTKTSDIRLDKENIKKYSIPFRVTSYKFTESVSGADAKAIKKAWKEAENTLTISFNGGHYQYKGYPITISMANKNTTSKPVAKAIKLNVKPNDVQPTWRYPEKKLISGDTVRVVTSGDVITASSDTSFWYAVDISGTEFTEAAFTLASVDASEWITKPDDDYIKIIGGNWVVSGESITATMKIAVLSVDIESADYKLSDQNKNVKTDDKGKVTLPVPIGSLNPTGTIPSYAVYIVSADGPYTVTTKGEKDDVKVAVTQASFDFLGRVTAPATVTISGKVKTDKETKTGITLTATNPSTKKKGALKVTVQGTLAPFYDSKNVESKTKTIEGETYTRNYLKGTKRVVVGKAPSAKFKAKGTKTITYRLANNTSDDIEGYDPYSVAYALNEVGLSFDTKKGIYAPDKSKLTKPTAGYNEDEDDTELQSIDICVIAENSVGSTPLFAELAIAGAKPSIKKDDKKITIPSSARKGARIPFRLVAGKTDVNSDTELTTANVKVSLASGTVPDGIALQSWTSMDCVVSASKILNSGDTITVSTDTAWELALLSTDKKTVSGDYMSASAAESKGYAVKDSSNYKAQFANGVSVKIGNTTEKAVDEEYTNTGVFVVTKNTRTANTKGAKLNLTLENLGTTAKGAITVVVEAASGDDTVYSTSTSTATTANAEGAKTAAKANVKSGHGYAPADETALEAEEAEETTEAEAKVTFGAARTADSLSAAQQAFLADNGYTVVAVLPEATAEADGQYDFEVVDLNENAPKGAKLVWLAFPKDGSSSEDDEIADFYDEAGEPIENVPASLKVKVSAWLRAGVTYEPVIAVKD